MFYITSKFHDNRVNTFGFMEGAFEAPPHPPGPGTPKKPRRNRVNGVNVTPASCLFLKPHDDMIHVGSRRKIDLITLNVQGAGTEDVSWVWEIKKLNK